MVSMRWGTLAAVMAGIVMLGCEAGRTKEAQPATPEPAAEEGGRLSSEDLRILVAVKGKALRQLEEALAASAGAGGDVLSRLKDLGASEREAALALGVDWRRYAWVKEEIARVLALQRQREDAELLAMELERSREDLKTQLERSHDASSRQFLQAQIASLERQLDTIEREGILDVEATAELQLIEGVRAELAELQGQQDRVQRRIREMVRDARGGGQAVPSRSDLRDGGQTGGVRQEERK